MTVQAKELDDAVHIAEGHTMNHFPRRRSRSTTLTVEESMGIALRDRTNVMEILVAEEVERQLKRCPSALLDYVKAVEVETHALNRLPPLYAASHEGLVYQKERARREYGQTVQTAVSRAIAAIRQDPLRRSTPLISEEDRVHHQLIIELANRFPTIEELKQTGSETSDGETSRARAAHFRRANPSRTLSHQRTKGNTAASAPTGDWGWDHRHIV